MQKAIQIAKKEFKALGGCQVVKGTLVKRVLGLKKRRWNRNGRTGNWKNCENCENWESGKTGGVWCPIQILYSYYQTPYRYPSS